MRSMFAVAELVLFASVPFWRGAALAHDMGADFTITSGTQVWSLDSGATTITGVSYVWTFPDAGGLNMKPASTAYNIYNQNDANGFTLNLNGGAITDGGDLRTANASGAAGNITVTNATGISLAVLQAGQPTTDNRTAGSISITQSNSFMAASVSTGAKGYCYTGSQTFTGGDNGGFTVTGEMNSAQTGNSDWNSPGGDISIQDYTSASIGNIYTYSVRIRGGHVKIGVSGNPIGGNIAVGIIGTSILGVGQYPSGGNVDLYANGSITAGDISAGIVDTSTTTPWRSGGSITVVSKGAFTGGVIKSQASEIGAAGNISIDGTDRSGAFTATSLNTERNTHGGKASGYISVANYSQVTVTGSMKTTQVSSDAGTAANAGYISVTNISGDITIGSGLAAGQDAFDLRSWSTGTKGALTLSSSGGKIAIANLNLSLMSSATLSAGGGKGFIRGPLLNFPVDSPTNGLLDAAVGQRIFVDARDINNAYLTNGYSGKFTLKSGGQLLFGIPNNGTVVVIK